VKIALDPHMLRHTTLLEVPAVVAGLGDDHIELSPDRARESCTFLRETIETYVGGWASS
jgi:hypothetical protein